MTSSRPQHKRRASIRANGAEVLRIRKKLGMTQKDLAVAIGYSERLIRKAESGEIVDAKSLTELAKHFTRKGAWTSLSELAIESKLPTKSFECESFPPLVQAWYDDGLRQSDPHKIDGLFADDLAAHITGTNIRGIDEFRQFHVNFFAAFDSIQTTIDNVNRDREWIFLTWTRKMRQIGPFMQVQADNNWITISGITAAKILQDRIVRFREFGDYHVLFQRLTAVMKE